VKFANMGRILLQELTKITILMRRAQYTYIVRSNFTLGAI